MDITRNVLTLSGLILVLTFASLYAVQASISQPDNAPTNPEIVDGIARSQAEIYTVTGRVAGPDGPMEDIPVFFDCCATKWRVHTDANGIYTFTTDGPQMNVSIIAVPPLEGMLGQGTRVLDIVSDTSNVNFDLAPGNLLAGQVVNQNGFPAKLDHDLYNSQGAKHFLSFTEHADFTLFLPPDEYTLIIGAPNQPWENHTVDLQPGDVPSWEVVIDVADDLLPVPLGVASEELPPRVELISIGPPNAAGIAHIVGAANAIPKDVPLLEIINLHTGNFTTTAVLADGSFEADILAPYGSALQLRYTRGGYSRSSGTGAILWHYPTSMTAQANDTSVFLVGRAGDYQGHWTVNGTINDRQFDPGDPFTATLNVMITGPQVDERFDQGDYKLVTMLHFERFFDASGQHHAKVRRGISTAFTPTGLPIDAMPNNYWSGATPLALEHERVIQATHRTSNTLDLSVTLTSTLPPTMPQGLYRPALILFLGPDEWQFPLAGNSLLCTEDNLDYRAELGFDENRFGNYMPVIQLGSPEPPRLPWALLVNVFSNGTRGTIAREEQGRIGLSNRIALQSECLIIPASDRYGRKLPYRLEPFIPTLASSLASDVEPYPPIIPLQFPGGELNVTVLRPDGSSEHLGSLPFQQARNGMESSYWTHYIGADRTLQKVYEVTTLSEQFVYEFEDYGLHHVMMNGYVEDVWGNLYQGGGTYEIWVAETLDLEPAVFPGQPFEVGDPLATTVVLQPSVPATVTLDFTLVPSNGVPITYVITGQANPYGYFHPPGAVFTMPVAGEYVLDVSAEYWDDRGVLWVGSSRGAGVVETPNSDLIAHGLRGITVFTDNRPQWFLSSQIHPDGLKENAPDTPEDDGFMLLYPYHTGDILWTSDQNNSIIAELSVHDLVGWYGDLLLSRYDQGTWANRIGRDLEERVALGELPLVTTTSSGRDWSLFPEDVDQWGYAYLSTQRPGVSVRGYVATDNLFRSYWSTDYKYDRQLGNGSEGDYANDIKLQYGGAVIRTPTHKEYLGYASMEVLIPFGQDDLGNRTFPPFQGYSGGPDGGPILVLKGEEVDLFLTPTALRPGSVLEVEDTVAIAGTMWPTLDSKGWFTFTAPSGAQRLVQGRANRFGYFYAADDNFVVDEPGVWTVEAHLLHDTVVPSTGLPATDYNKGDLLGARACEGQTDPVGCGQWYFYVTQPDAPTLALDMPRLSYLFGPVPFTFEGNVPGGWTQVKGKFTAVMSGFILEEGDLTISDDKFRYTFDPWRLHDDFPNLDVETQDSVAELVDTFTFSFMLSGEDGQGQAQHRARSVVLQGKCVQALSQSTQSSCPNPLTGISIVGLDSGYTDIEYIFTAQPDPANATEPITYTWSTDGLVSGQGTTDTTYSWDTTGVYTVSVTAKNCGDSVHGDHTITLSEQPPSCDVAITGVTIDGLTTGDIDTDYTFSANVAPPSATLPISYTWSADSLVSGRDTISATYRWGQSGVHDVTVSVGNCGGSANDIHSTEIGKEYVYLPVVLRNH